MSYIYGGTSLEGNTEDSLDSIDGDDLVQDDVAIINTNTVTYFYKLNTTSGAIESSPDIISPYSNAGDKRWILSGTSHKNEGINALGVLDGTSIIDIDLDDGDITTATLSSSAKTFTFSNPSTIGNSNFMLYLTNGGLYPITWPSSVVWEYGYVPVLSPTNVDVFLFTTNDAGSTWFGFHTKFWAYTEEEEIAS